MLNLLRVLNLVDAAFAHTYYMYGSSLLLCTKFNFSRYRMYTAVELNLGTQLVMHCDPTTKLKFRSTAVYTAVHVNVLNLAWGLTS
eukprot:SAG31_NODE_1770_length_7309_cov_56.975867_6_plen_86_part_00